MSVSVVRSRALVTLRTALSRKIGLLIRSAHACKKSDGKNTRKWGVKHVSFLCAPKSARRAAPKRRNVDVPAAVSSAIQWTGVPTKHVITWIVKFVTRIGAGFAVVIQATRPHARTPNISSHKRKSFSKRPRSKSKIWKKSFSKTRGVSFSLTLLKTLQLSSRWMLQ